MEYLVEVASAVHSRSDDDVLGLDFLYCAHGNVSDQTTLVHDEDPLERITDFLESVSRYDQQLRSSSHRGDEPPNDWTDERIQAFKRLIEDDDVSGGRERER